MDVGDIFERVIYITLNLLDWYFIFRTAEFIPHPKDLWDLGAYGNNYLSSSRFMKKTLKVEANSSKKVPKVQYKTVIDFAIFTFIKYGFYSLHILGLVASVIMNLISGITLIIKPTGPGSRFGLVWWMDKYTIYS